MLISTSAPTLDTGRLDELAGIQDEGVDLVPEIVALFVTDTDKRLSRASDEVDDANTRGLRVIAHDLAGACGTIGAARMQALASQLEATLTLGHVQTAGSIVQTLVEEFGQVRAALGRYLAAEASSHR